jgi:bifunctional UDP-N-acetylglucosamine pyrophosphorylase/glucosamine-1-phosphate N-acetyltransferase
MKAVILAAGQSKRFWPLNRQHKGLFKIMGRPLIFYTIENLKKAGIKELIIIQGPEKDIEKTLQLYNFTNLQIRYVIQEKPLGTGDALKKVKIFIKDKFLVLNGDDFYSARDIKKCLKKKFCILLKTVQDPQNFGQVVVKKDKVQELVEKPKKEVSKLVNTGLYLLDKSIFNFKIEKSKRGEYELVDFLKELIKKEKLNFEIAENWIPISYPWDLFNLNEFLLSKIKRKILGKVEKGAILKGKIIIDEGAIIKGGTYIEGPVYIGKNCQIGPNCFIRKFTSIGDNCYIGQAVEIKNSIIGDNSKISRLNYLENSIIDKNCNLGKSTVSLGCILGENVKTGKDVLIALGVLIGFNRKIKSNSLISQDIK